MVQAYHVIFSMYGYWLPNDPRGSYSNFVASWELFRYGPATKTDSRESVAAAPHDVQARLAAKQSLKYPPVVIDGHQALSIIHGFDDEIRRAGLVVYACAILPDHVHMVIERYRYKIEQVVRRLKAAASIRLAADKRHPMARRPGEDGSLPTPWTRGQWKGYLNSVEETVRAIAYVEKNPTKEGKRPQQWSFVVPFRGFASGSGLELLPAWRPRGSANRG
jgi:REP-associated tyrosine transposase